jgi:hypothetical protein
MRRSPQKETVIIMNEKVYIINKTKKGNFPIERIEERAVAEQSGLRHLTTIIVPFDVRDNKWILHDRFNKLAARAIASGKKVTEVYQSWNLNGGHVTPPENGEALVGTNVTEAMIYESFREELGQEVLRKAPEGMSGDKTIEIWNDGEFKGAKITAFSRHVELFKAFPVGWASYSKQTSKGFNSEHSFVFALPITFADEADESGFMIADDVEKGRHVLLNHRKFTFDEVKKLASLQTAAGEERVKGEACGIEVCDAITRLFMPENLETMFKLQRIIKDYMA